MSPDLRRTLLIDAVFVAVLVALAFILLPGVAMVGIIALLVVILGAISFIVSEVRARRREKRQGAWRRNMSGSRRPGP